LRLAQLAFGFPSHRLTVEECSLYLFTLIFISDKVYYNSVYEMFKYRPQIGTFFISPDFDPIEKFVAYCGYFGFAVLHTLGSVWDVWVGNTMMDQTIMCSDENWDVAVNDEKNGEDELLRTVVIHTPGGIVLGSRPTAGHIPVRQIFSVPQEIWPLTIEISGFIL
jgi:hypothetical protein